jgi:circadian clock protein KaiB
VGIRERRVLSLRLFVTGDSPDSSTAIANLKGLFPNGASSQVEIEIVDVQREPARGARDGILVTPTLLKLRPAPICRILGNLKNRDALLRLLGIEQKGESHGAG